MTSYIITLADNGYILEDEDSSFISVYQGTDLPNELCQELCAEINDSINNVSAVKYKVTIAVEPIENV